MIGRGEWRVLVDGEEQAEEEGLPRQRHCRKAQQRISNGMGAGSSTPSYAYALLWNGGRKTLSRPSSAVCLPSSFTPSPLTKAASEWPLCFFSSLLTERIESSVKLV
uniref:Uncharacterized protein n=1 Tax=Globodera rostochiensis TaxID=31243 RepID=A0A914IG25_GLORO